MSIPFYQKKYNEIINLNFLCKLEKLESDNIFPKIYTGIKWITFDKPLTTNYQLYEINDKFNLYGTSRWRLSSTSKKVNQKIFFENINTPNNE